MLTSKWRSEIQERWGIQPIEHLRLPSIKETLWVTRCSRTKKGVERGTPKDLYISSITKYFYRLMEEFALPYGVLSDRYGLHMYDEELEYYDVHPEELTDLDKQTLGALIREKAMARGFGVLIFYSPSPLMSVPYFEMLYHSGLSVFYTTALNLAK